MTSIYLGLGTNLGKRENNLSQCVNLLSANQEIDLKKLSSIYETEPYGFTEQPRFLNMVVEIETMLAPNQLLRDTQDIEKKLGKKKLFHWGPRKIDIDILSYQDRVIKQEMLTIPHAQLHLRKFVLIPLNEIAPGFIHPLFNKNINQLLDECQDESKVTKIMHGKNLIS